MKITMTDFVNKRYRTDHRFDCFYSAVSALSTSLMVADIDSNFQQQRISLIGIICSSFFFYSRDLLRVQCIRHTFVSTHHCTEHSF